MKVSESVSTGQEEKNRVLEKNFAASTNFFFSDLILRNYLKNNLSPKGLSYMSQKLESLGADAAGKMNELSLLADTRVTSDPGFYFKAARPPIYLRVILDIPLTIRCRASGPAAGETS